MSKIIGKVIATERHPSTINEFYFWTKPELILNPFDVVKVKHVNSSISYGVIEEISHITDTANFLSEFISSDFGDVESVTQTERIKMNYVKASVIGNTKGIYIPLLNNNNVSMANKDEIAAALGLSDMKHKVLCGYLEMYEGADQENRVTLPVYLDSHFLVGPEGAHLNISGISGLAAKTSYAMFLLKSIQYKNLHIESPEEDDDVAFVIFNVKGKDLLAIDELNEFDSPEEKLETQKLYQEELDMEPDPFFNVSYYYPYSNINLNIKNTYQDEERLQKQFDSKNAFYYKYEYERDKDSLDLMLANIDDPTQSMDAIINYIISNQGNFGRITDWQSFIDELETKNKPGGGDKEIPVQSWRKFYRNVHKSIYKNSIFDTIKNNDNEIRLNNAIKTIKKNDIHVVDIAKLNENMQSFVFGDVMRSIVDLQLGQYSSELDQEPPSKIVIFIDELNRYAASDAPKNSPILRQILDIAERGRSLGIVLFSAEQFKSAVHQRVTGNCSTHAYGRTNAIEIAKADYKYIPPVYKTMMTRLKQGEYIIQNPVFRSLLSIKFPKPVYKHFK